MKSKPYILVSHQKVVSWLYVALLPRLKNHLNASIVLLLPEGTCLPKAYKDVLQQEDKVVFVPNFFESESINSRPEEEYHRKSKENRGRFKFNLFQDILLQERDYANRMLERGTSKADNALSNLSNEALNIIICRYFDFFDEIFSQNTICLSLVWPRSAWEAVVGIISQHYKVLVTFPYTSKGDGNLAYWSDGMFANSLQIRQEYAKTSATKPFKLEERRLPGRPAEFSHSNLSKYFSAKESAKRIILGLINRVIFVTRDLRKIAAHALVFKKIVRDEMMAFLYWRAFKSLCYDLEEFDFRQKYAFFAFQNQPEFSVEGRCKEFFNQKMIILTIADSLPPNAILLIKEHAWSGHRKIDYYEELLRHPAIKMVSPVAPATTLIQNATCTFSLNGTVLFESAAFGVPSGYFSDRSEFSVLDNTVFLENLNSIRHWVSDVFSGDFKLNRKDSAVSARRYIDAMHKISFEAEPLYYRGDGEVETSEIDKAYHLLLCLLDKYKQSPDQFGFEIKK